MKKIVTQKEVYLCESCHVVYENKDEISLCPLCGSRDMCNNCGELLTNIMLECGLTHEGGLAFLSALPIVESSRVCSKCSRKIREEIFEISKDLYFKAYKNMFTEIRECGKMEMEQHSRDMGDVNEFYPPDDKKPTLDDVLGMYQKAMEIESEYKDNVCMQCLNYQTNMCGTCMVGMSIHFEKGGL